MRPEDPGEWLDVKVGRTTLHVGIKSNVWRAKPPDYPRIPIGRFSTYYPSSGNLKRTDGRKVHQLDSEKIGPMKGAVTHSILP